MNRLTINQEVCKYLEDILGCKKCDLNSEDIVFTINKQAKAFYEKHGFIKTGKSRVIKRGLDFV